LPSAIVAAVTPAGTVGARFAAGVAVVPGDPTAADRLQAAAPAIITPVMRRNEILEVMSAR
jgi:hypothetical protein